MAHISSFQGSTCLKRSPMSARVRVNVLSVFETPLHKVLGAIVTVDIDTKGSIEELKTKTGVLAMQTERGFPSNENAVPSLFVVRPTHAEAVRTATNAQAVYDLIMRRENYLRAVETVGSLCNTAGIDTAIVPGDSIHAVALVLSPTRPTATLTFVAQPFMAKRRDFESMLHSTVADKTLPIPSLQSTPIYVRDDYDRMYSVICKQLGLFPPAPTHEHGYELRSKRPKLTPRQDDDVVFVTGTSGTGLTTLLWYLLYKLAATHTVVFDVPSSNYFVLVRPDGTVLNGDRHQCFRATLADPEAVYLVEMKSKDDILDLLYQRRSTSSWPRWT